MSRTSIRRTSSLFIAAVLLLGAAESLAATYYVDPSGSDGGGNGSAASSWKSLAHAASEVAADQGHVIHLNQGTYVETQPAILRRGVSVEGAGAALTTLTVPAGYVASDYLLRLESPSILDDNQTLRDFAIDGNAKSLQGGSRFGGARTSPFSMSRSGMLVSRVSS